MEKEKIVDLIRNPQNISREDIYTLEKWVSQYPYFQLGHILIAKIANDNKIPNKEVKLNYAAIYSPNRGVLKGIILRSLSDFPQYKNNSIFTEQSDLANNSADEVTSPPFSDPVGEELQIKSDNYNQKLKEEYLLKKERHESESVREEMEDEIPAPKVNQNIVNEVLANLEKAKKLKKEFLDRDREAEIYSPSPSHEHQESGIETFDEEEIEENVAASNQRDLIDTFIENEKHLGKIKPRLNSENQSDLSERSTSLSDDMVSENLATILRKQGKKEKAIDIYKKLIWKFPQKRAYFATLIEELKNN